MYRIKHRRTGRIEEVSEEKYKLLMSKPMFAEHYIFLPVIEHAEVLNLEAEELISRHATPEAEPKKTRKKTTNTK